MMPYEEWNAELHTRITDVRFFQFEEHYPRFLGKNARLGSHGSGGTVTAAKIYTEAGIDGWGQLCSDIDEAKTKSEYLTGKYVSDIFNSESGIKDPFYKPFDIVLHDLAGRILGIPVCRMINPDCTLTARVYDGAIYMNDIIPEEKPVGIDEVIQNCLDDYRLGYRTFKIKIGRGNKWMGHDEGLKRDIEIVNRIHECLPAARIMVDANDGYSVRDVIDFLEGIENVELYWFEEPFREDEWNDRQLKKYLLKNRPMTLIADGESMTDIELLRNLSSEKILDVWQPDVCGQGFTSWRTLMKEIADNGWLASPHAWGNVVKTRYCAHLAAAYPHHIPCIEGVPGTSDGLTDKYSLSDGVMTIPDAPGFGTELAVAKEI